MNKGYGAQRVRQELCRRGIDRQLLDDALSQHGNLENLLRLWNKKFKFLPKDSREKCRQVNFLRYRGFSSSEIEDLFAYLAEHDV